MSEAEKTEKRGFFSRLKAGLTRSTSALVEGVSAIFQKRRLDDAALEELEELLIRTDLGVKNAGSIVAELRRTRFGKDVTDDEVRRALAEQIAAMLGHVQKPFQPEGSKPFVTLVVGVNGTGKTTTIGKIGARLAGEGRKVMFAAGDTFRAAAIEQLQIWGQRIGAPVISGAAGADAAGLVFTALERARAEGADVLLVDTAGRLQNKAHLMDELKKVVRVMRKVDPTAPHATLLVLDATTGQNAISQVEVFREAADVTGLVVTKLDGTARGGVLVAIAEKFGVPVHFVGVGEKAEDLQPFDAAAFARALTGAVE